MPSSSWPIAIKPAAMNRAIRALIASKSSDRHSPPYIVDPPGSAKRQHQSAGDEVVTPEQILLNPPVLLDQVSVFDGCCRLYAPRYRQATLAALKVPAAMDVAYGDVATAFRCSAATPQRLRSLLRRLATQRDRTRRSVARWPYLGVERFAASSMTRTSVIEVQHIVVLCPAPCPDRRLTVSPSLGT